MKRAEAKWGEERGEGCEREREGRGGRRKERQRKKDYQYRITSNHQELTGSTTSAQLDSWIQELKETGSESGLSPSLSVSHSFHSLSNWFFEHSSS